MIFCSRVAFFFFKQKTAYERRISDWSSDVCSSDLLVGHRAPRRRGTQVAVAHLRQRRAIGVGLAFVGLRPVEIAGGGHDAGSSSVSRPYRRPGGATRDATASELRGAAPGRSDKRRVGKAWGSVGISPCWRYHLKKK